MASLSKSAPPAISFSIITPSYRANQWLPLCIASVADQSATISVEHIVQDAGSDDGTLDWLTTDPRVTAYVEKDLGMYDAINRGMRKATGDLCAYLNCDEQYLPRALQKVAGFFLSHPNVDVLLTDAVIVDPDGNYICHRKSQVPFRDQLWFRMPVLTCAMFMRRKVFSEHDIFFDVSKKVAGDVFWVMEIQKRGLKMALLREFTSTFTETEGNLGLGSVAEQEYYEIRDHRPGHIRRFKWAYLLYHRIRSVCSGIYFQKPFSYFLYTMEQPARRKEIKVSRPTQVWKNRVNIDRDALKRLKGQKQES